MSCFPCCSKPLKGGDGCSNFYFRNYHKALLSFTLKDVTKLDKSIKKGCKTDVNEIMDREFVTEWYDGGKKSNFIINEVQELKFQCNKVLSAKEDPRFENLEDARKYLNEKFGDKLPYCISYPDPWTDKAIVDLCTLHVGLNFLTKNDDDEYEIDLLLLRDFDVREGYHPWGAKIVLDEDLKKIVSIRILDDVFEPPKKSAKAKEKDAWEVAKLRFCATLQVAVTAKDHLLEIHWCTAGPLAIHSRRNLSWNNPLRTLLEPFHFNTPQINYQATNSLFNKNGLLERAFPIDQSEFPRLAQFVSQNFKAKTVPQQIEDQGLEDFDWLPLCAEANEFWHIVKRFVIGMLRPYIEEASSEDEDSEEEDTGDDITAARFGEFEEEVEAWEEGMRGEFHVDEDEMNLVDLITYAIYGVTARHEATGTVGFDFAWMCPSTTMAGAKTLEAAFPGRNVSYTLFLLAGLTNQKMPPLAGDLHILFRASEVKETVQTFMDEMKELTKNVAKSNKKRSRLTPMYDPKLMEISVAV